MYSTIEWRAHAPVTIDDKGLPTFTDLPNWPGLYRLTMKNGEVYIGEAGDLKRRLGEYRSPTQGNAKEEFIQHAIVESEGAKLHLYTDGNLENKTDRCQIEAEEIKIARENNIPLLNGGHPHNAKSRLERTIRIMEQKLVGLRQELAALA